LHFTLFLHAPNHFQSEITGLLDLNLLHLFSKVEEMVKEDYDWESELQRLVQVDGINGASKGVPEMVVEDGPLISFNAYDRRLLAGAIIAERIRSAVRMELGYTCSVVDMLHSGISPDMC
jgi:hypothetical protein